MVSLIPRLTSFAVSGTPARSQVSDLSHVLRCISLLFMLSSPNREREDFCVFITTSAPLGCGRNFFNRIVLEILQHSFKSMQSGQYRTKNLTK